jgi:hypothetical protein
MRKIPALLAVAAVAVAVAVAPAVAQNPVTSFTFKGKVSPKKAGTKAHPQGVKLTGDLAFKTETAGVEPPIITGSTILLPKTGAWNGGKYKSCSLSVLNRKGPSGCDKKSIVGKAKGHARADTVDALPTITFVNGGKTKLYAYTVLYHPALVKEPVILKIKKLSGSKWGYRVSFKVPDTLQVVAGVPITLESLHFSVGGTKSASKLITTTGCKGGKHVFEATTDYLYSDLSTSSSTITSSVACSK